MAKVALVIWLAYSLAKKAERVKTFTVGFLPHLIVAGVFMLLCMKQPDFGSAVVLLLLTFTHALRRGGEGRLHPRRLDPRRRPSARPPSASASTATSATSPGCTWTQHRQDLAYQPFQSVMSFGSGGTGGPRHRARASDALPAGGAHRLRRGHRGRGARVPRRRCALCAVYLLLVVARRARGAARPDDFGSFLAFGLSTMFGVQALVNLSVALAILPTKGLTLPFVSFGGSSLLVNAAAAGILLNISRQSGERPQETPPPAPVEESPLPSRSRAKSSPRPRREPSLLLIAGGGTGGHVFPAVGGRRGPRRRWPTSIRLLRYRAGRRGARGAGEGLELELLDVEPMKGGGPVRAVRGAFVAALATRRRSASCAPAARARS